MQSTRFAIRCADFVGSILLPRQRGWCHLRRPWAAALAFSCYSRRVWISPGSQNRLLEWPITSPTVLDTSVDNWTSPHLYSDTYCAVLAQKASHNSVPWSSSDSSLLQTPTKKWVSPAEKKHFWGSYRFHAFPFPSPLLRKSKPQILSCPDPLSDSVRPWLPKWNTTFPFLFITQEEITSCMGHIRSVIGFTPLHHSY